MIDLSQTQARCVTNRARFTAHPAPPRFFVDTCFEIPAGPDLDGGAFWPAIVARQPSIWQLMRSLFIRAVNRSSRRWTPQGSFAWRGFVIKSWTEFDDGRGIANLNKSIDCKSTTHRRASGSDSVITSFLRSFSRVALSLSSSCQIF